MLVKHKHYWIITCHFLRASILLFIYFTKFINIHPTSRKLQFKKFGATFTIKQQNKLLKADEVAGKCCFFVGKVEAEVLKQFVSSNFSLRCGFYKSNRHY